MGRVQCQKPKRFTHAIPMNLVACKSPCPTNDRATHRKPEGIFQLVDGLKCLNPSSPSKKISAIWIIIPGGDGHRRCLHCSPHHYWLNIHLVIQLFVESPFAPFQIHMFVCNLQSPISQWYASSSG